MAAVVAVAGVLALPGDAPASSSPSRSPRTGADPTEPSARSYTVVAAEEAGQAAAALRVAGMGRLVDHGAGVVSFAGDPAAAGRALAGRGLAGVVTPDVRGSYAEVPNDPGYRSQWALPAVNAPAAWQRTHGSPQVTVAVVDSGVDAAHPDLATKLGSGWDAMRGAPLPLGNTDPSGHGTAVAGVIAAVSDNGGGLASLGWDTRVVAVKDGDREPSRAATVAGIRWAADRGVRIINVSSGYPTFDPNEADAIAYARARGAVVVAAAGDLALQGNPRLYPAAGEGVVAVGATGFGGGRALYSNIGDYVDLVAPGGTGAGENATDIHVLAPGGGTTFRAGTSFAAPLVSAAVALLLGARPDMSALAAADLVTATAGDLGPRGKDPEHGSGALDADAALAAAGVEPRASAPPSPSGYWTVASDGGVFAFGAARFAGSTGALRLNAPILGMAATPSGDGYWLVASDGGIFSFGDARFFGSTGAMRLNRPIVGMASTPSGNGYWLVASDGGIFSFGDAVFRGSTGAIRLNRPIVGMAATPTGNGYWLVASDGGIFGFGDARFFGSTGSIRLNSPIVAAATTRAGDGYWMVASDGGIFAFGDAGFFGSSGNLRLAAPMVGMATSRH